MITNIIQFLHTTAAYQAAVANLLVGEANFAAKQLNLQDWTPLEGTNGAIVEVMSPPLGISGCVATSNHVIIVKRGHVSSVMLHPDSQMRKSEISPAELAKRPSLVDTNGAHSLATQWLAGISIDVEKLEGEQPFRCYQQVMRLSDSPNEEKTLTNLPVFHLNWGKGRSRLSSSEDSVSLTLRGDTKQLTSLKIGEPKYFLSPPKVLTNTSDLLGKIPPPQHFVEELFGGVTAYAAVAFPEKVEAWLLTSFADENSRGNAPRTKAIQLSSARAKSFSEPLLAFDSYQWTAVKMCAPDFGLKLRFTRGKEIVEFRLCYECDILEVTYQGKTKTENFDFAHNQLRKAIQDIFPKDKKIQAIEKNDDDQARKQFEAMLKSL